MRLSNGAGSMSVVGPLMNLFFSSGRRHTRLQGDWSSDVCSSDLGVVPIPGTLSVSISPTPESAVQHSYVVTVTNSANGAPVAGATLVLHNYTTGNPQTMVSTTKTSDAQGHATFATTLHFKKQRIVHGAGDSEIILISPTLTVSHSGFSPVEIVLLEED